MSFQGKILKEDWCSTIQKLGDNWGIAIRPVDTLKTLVSWLPPEDGWVKANFDGSLLANRAGYGAVLRNMVGEMLLVVAIQEKIIGLRFDIGISVSTGVSLDQPAKPMKARNLREFREKGDNAMSRNFRAISK
ncbi:hypothetical protein QJS10_CPA07g00431 [Acorus calamus]|uniref:RNase H type-1 domain-containing protein n=1 Tax=Acorus calamus TaxID=4465 RepID=A0AAV9EDK7_ACOCL|nr:hypothetical protein QJS10_CPA07g00431 [Acorus calamus]